MRAVFLALQIGGSRESLCVGETHLQHTVGSGRIEWIEIQDVCVNYAPINK